MKIGVVLRQVPDLIEPLELDASGTALDLGRTSFLVNEWDNHALEQAILLKEAGGGSVTVVALDFGDVDDTLYTAAAKGADRIIKIPWDRDGAPSLPTMATIMAEVLRGLELELLLIGCQAHDEWEGTLAPRLALALGLPYVGVIRGVRTDTNPGTIQAFKEFPGAVMARMSVRLPAVLGILAAEQPPRYVPVGRIRGAMKSTQFEQKPVSAAPAEPLAKVRSLYPPTAAGHAEMLDGSEQDVASRIVQILEEKGAVK